jgi:hypothetical protein
MAFAAKTKDDVAYALATQAAWGTAIVGSASMASPSGMRLDVEPTVFVSDTKIRAPNRSMVGQRYRDTTALVHDTKGSMPSISFTGQIKKNDLAHWLYAVMQNVTEDAVADKFNKVFTFPTTQPDFTAGTPESWFATIIKKHPTASLSQMMQDAICRDLTLRWEPEGGEGGVGKFTANMIGRGTLSYTYNSTGTLTRNPSTSSDLFYFHDITLLTAGGVALHPVLVEFSITNNAQPVSVDQAAAGKFLTYVLGAPEYSVTATIKVAWDANAQGVQDNQITQSTSAWVVEWGTAATDGHLKFELQAQPGPAPDEDADLNTIEFTLTGVSSGATVPLTVSLTDAVDRSW